MKRIIKVMRVTLILILSISTLAYVAYVFLFYSQQRAMLFPAGNRSTLIDVDTAAVRADADHLVPVFYPAGDLTGFAWYLPPLGPTGRRLNAAPALILAHGNGEINDDWVDSARGLQSRGVGVLLLEIPGYGHAPGEPSRDAIVTTALAGYDWLVTQPEVDPDLIYLLGHSIGSGSVTAIGDARPTRGMVLLSPFASIARLAQERYLPPALVKDRFDNLTLLRGYAEPVLIMHGRQDTLIPFAHSQALDSAAPNSRLIPLNCGHGGCISDMNRFWEQVVDFMGEAPARSN